MSKEKSPKERTPHRLKRVCDGFHPVIGRRGVLPLCQCAASLPRLFDDEMHLNHSPMMGPILAARFL
ncbi:MAG: hypothetical protein OEZ39_12035, partial [Gammaproteobacteria bacterium]|nr:hypothetical protein [Gammaproteobacteria bacterium]